VTNDDLALRSSIGLFVFMPPLVTERFLDDAGLRLVRQEDATENIVLTSGRWHDARAARRDDLLGIEGEERFEGLQRFFAAVHRLTSERRLSRFMYLAEKP
ncbi:MAG TPA: class I SAM-dependent methyltransferase, partial [Candidatus Krumholzibacteria bacterium]